MNQNELIRIREQKEDGKGILVIQNDKGSDSEIYYVDNGKEVARVERK
jgi:hypothetical protein